MSKSQMATLALSAFSRAGSSTEHPLLRRSLEHSTNLSLMALQQLWLQLSAPAHTHIGRSCSMACVPTSTELWWCLSCASERSSSRLFLCSCLEKLHNCPYSLCRVSFLLENKTAVLAYKLSRFCSKDFCC